MGLLDGLFGRKKAGAGLLDPTPGLAVGDEWRTSFPTMQQQQPAPAEKLSFLEGGKLTGKDALGLALGAIGDTFAQQSGGQAIMAPMVMKGIMGAREAKRAAESAAAKREQDNQDWLWREHNKSPEEGEFTRTLRAANIDPASEAGQALYRRRAATMASPAPQMIGDPQYGYQYVTPPAPDIPGITGPGATGSVPTVSDEASYNAIPPGGRFRHPDGTIRTKGGGAGNGAGNFRRGIPSGSPLAPWP